MEDKGNLAGRVERLETAVENLTVQVERFISKAAPKTSAPVSTPPPPPPIIVKQTAPGVQPQKPAFIPAEKQPASPVAAPSFTLPEHMRKSEYWLNKIGIGLLLFGAVFLFKYSVDQGWLTPAIRVVFGLALGLALAVIGFRSYGKKKHFSQVLLGGSIATFYITGFSAFQLFHLVAYPVAFTFFIAVTCYAFYLSLKQNEFIFSLIAIIGGLGTPFLLYTGAGSIPGLMLYLCVLLAGSSGIYFFKGWWSFFWTSCIGGITVIWMAMFEGKSLTYAPILDKISIEIALFLMLPFFWLVPLVREIVALKDPKMVNAEPPKSQDTTPNAYQPNLSEININLLTVVIPFLGLFLSTAVWQWSDEIFGVISLALALVFGYAGRTLNSKTSLKNFAYTHLVVALALVAISFQFFFEGDALFVALAIQALAIHLVRIKIGSRSLAPVGHVLFGLVAMVLLMRISNGREGLVLLNSQALSDLIIPAGAFGLVRIFQNMDEKRAYLIGGFLALAGIMLRELDGNIEFFVIAIESAALLYVASRMQDKGILTVSHLFGAVVALWLVVRLLNPAVGTVIFNEKSLIDLIVIAMIADATFILSDKEVKKFYFLAAHVALLLWFLRELSPLENGQGLVSVAWGVYTIGLFVAGLRTDIKSVTKVAMITLLVLVGKLFLIDLANIETIWRIVIFMGFGAILLFLSYYFQSLWRTKKG